MSHHNEPTDAGEKSLDKRIWASLVLNVLITLAEFLGGLVSGSLALLSDAAHNVGDVVALILTLGARLIGRRPPTTRHTYGFKRVEIIAATVNALTLFVLAALIAHEAILRLAHPQPPSQGIMLGVALVALAANAGSVLLLRRHDRHDVNVQSAFLHMIQDALASLAVVVAALLANTPAGPWLDPITALAIGLLILVSAYKLLRKTFTTLLEGVPHDMDAEEVVRSVAKAFPNVHLHHVHLWENGPGQRLFTAHLVVGPKTDALAVTGLIGRVRKHLEEEWGIQHVTLEPEVEECDSRKTFHA
jgi:cobalt-zinc-cadmium efflux system protein